MLSEEDRIRTTTAAVNAVKEIGYVGAGTMEFLLDSESCLRFMEMNTRLQVEHSVSEMRTGRDLVVEQIQVAAGRALSFSQEDVEFKGATIECRINAEDPYNSFRPSPGLISKWEVPASIENLRIDTHVESGYEVPVHYDSLLCKVITQGKTRDAACDTMIEALEQFWKAIVNLRP